ncbi:ribonuclease HII [Patescibacteria group bacterium]|nr:ribonuclease HII [Patescibacteria group bacterium]
MKIGIDEVGRGAWAGPVVVGAVGLADLTLDRLLTECRVPELRDSKKYSRQQRERIFDWCENRLIWAVGVAEAEEIDDSGLSAAIRSAAGRAITDLRAKGVPISRITADAGLFHPYESEIPTERLVRGDEYIQEISLASIMAKVWRDRLMIAHNRAYPAYGFERHVGYGTAAHRAAIREYGLTPLHRHLFLRRFSADTLS